MRIQIHLQSITGEIYSIEIDPAQTFNQLDKIYKKLTQKKLIGLPYLITTEKRLVIDYSMALSSYSINDGDTIYQCEAPEKEKTSEIQIPFYYRIAKKINYYLSWLVNTIRDSIYTLTRKEIIPSDEKISKLDNTNSLSSQSKLIYQLVKNELPLGSSNMTLDIYSNIGYKRAFALILYEFLDKFLLPTCADHNLTWAEYEVQNEMILAIFAQALECGACTEQAALVFVKSLEFEIKEDKEIFFLKGNRLKKHFQGILNDKPIFSSYEAHKLTIFNRDSKNSTLSDISTYKGVTIVDTWHTGQCLEYKNHQSPKDTDLTYNFFKPTLVQSTVSVTKKLGGNEWIKHANVLKVIKELLNRNILKFLKPENTENETTKIAIRIIEKMNRSFGKEFEYINMFLERINKYFDDKISIYTNFANHPKIRCLTQKNEILSQEDSIACREYSIKTSMRNVN